MQCRKGDTHVDVNASLFENLYFRHAFGQIPEELVAVLVPFDRVQSLSLQIVRAFQLRAGARYRVVSDAHVQQLDVPDERSWNHTALLRLLKKKKKQKINSIQYVTYICAVHSYKI